MCFHLCLAMMGLNICSNGKDEGNEGKKRNGEEEKEGITLLCVFNVFFCFLRYRHKSVSIKD